MDQVVVDSVEKSFPKAGIRAVDGVTFTVGKGELFGLIGPDGAGKTTLFRLMTTLLVADRGKILVNGWDTRSDYRSIRNIIGYMPGRFSLYQDLTVEENLRFFATLFRTTIADNYDLIRDLYQQIEPFRHRRAGKLSGGMKQKLALCCALVHKPSVLFLDEPTTGVDPVSRRELWEMLKRLKGQGIAIVVSTPYMDEAKLCDRIALMHRGKIISAGTPQTIVQQSSRMIWAIRGASMAFLLDAVKRFDGTRSCYPFGEYAHVTFHQQESGPEELRSYLHNLGFIATELKPADVTIEDYFLEALEHESIRDYN
jgi:ABC-2 type transport system ATP-binding protein